jgi:hypothetical protein
MGKRGNGVEWEEFTGDDGFLVAGLAAKLTAMGCLARAAIHAKGQGTCCRSAAHTPFSLSRLIADRPSGEL